MKQFCFVLKKFLANVRNFDVVMMIYLIHHSPISLQCGYNH